LKMEIVEVNYNVDSDDFTIVFGVVNDDDEVIMEVSQNISLKDAKELPNYEFIKSILEAVKQDTMKGLN
jgi:hypothetical protein